MSRKSEAMRSKSFPAVRSETARSRAGRKITRVGPIYGMLFNQSGSGEDQRVGGADLLHCRSMNNFVAEVHQCLLEKLIGDQARILLPHEDGNDFQDTK